MALEPLVSARTHLGWPRGHPKTLVCEIPPRDGYTFLAWGHDLGGVGRTGMGLAFRTGMGQTGLLNWRNNNAVVGTFLFHSCDRSRAVRIHRHRWRFVRHREGSLLRVLDSVLVQPAGWTGPALLGYLARAASWELIEGRRQVAVSVNDRELKLGDY
jgi:hypothetical protein